MLPPLKKEVLPARRASDPHDLGPCDLDVARWKREMRHQLYLFWAVIFVTATTSTVLRLVLGISP